MLANNNNLKLEINCKGKTLEFSTPKIMGILNITPDSFSDGGKFVDVHSAIQKAKEMVLEGASIIDIGAQSSRPGSKQIPTKEELGRIVPILEEITDKMDTIISIDTYNPEVADTCLTKGAHIINDITGLQQKSMRDVIKKHDAGAIIMHMKGKPENMQKNPHYGDVVAEVNGFLATQTKLAENEGISSIMIDPGIGFGKTTEHNIELIKNLDTFTKIGKPIVLGTSRKSFIGDLSGAQVNKRLGGTIASNVYGALRGANILRVHDVFECNQAIQIINSITKK